MQPRNMSMSGVVDLAAVKAAGEAKQKAEQARAEAARTGAAPAGATRLVFDVDEAGFQEDVLQRSTEVPVVIDFWAEWCEPCKQLGPLLENLAAEYAGKFVLAKIDVDANQMLFQQFGVQGIPAVFAVVAGQPIPLFQGAVPEGQLRQVLDQLVQVAEQQFGIVGVPVDPAAAEQAEAAAPPPVGPYDAALTAAADALDAGDLDGAIRAYRNVLADDPTNPEAKLGLAQAELLKRVQGLNPQTVRQEAADRPTDVQAQITAADLDLVGGHVEDAFGRLVDAVQRTAGDDREAARVRLLELFEVIGADDPRVTKARTALARVLF
ncbi:tetratricopeptide repeat protein [Streptomyces noursei]|uniref:Co-chaperone YbbN n=1 Tax=Streptomyces noursei TaxID=1971 RepID=A0A401R7R5_STRNR|nr:tetratricopeptide repeat protein [Streptomyces noursei]AKA06098.1 thioredoxin [Streptomyces noursei ZPM]EOT04944.1 thioredoxin [Streptomyces noursei CCRC 11814]EXU90303.1 thioredoxin [Streptomyces noursei PD-1]UWS74487.1 tetratricopeptide repeat protein [Streptomyces noursei]GCB93667.1 co-chaperone YbbN [Streptomyces noursei]